MTPPSSRSASGERRAPRSRARHGRGWWPYIAAALVVCVALVLAVAGVVVGTALAIGGHLPPVDALYNPPSEASRIYAADGQLIASLYQENRASVPLAKIPMTLRRAVIDTEDAAFYHHHGIALRGVLRASFRNVRERGLAEGGSTITQQLARNLFLTNEKALSRKIAEMMLAIQIERRLTKDEILERYLNQVYFGQGAYGVEAASEVYFGKSVTTLNLPDSALLAGLIRAPSFYSPYDHLDRAKVRRSEVLQRMVDVGDITPAQMRVAAVAPVHLVEKGNLGYIGIRAPYFVSYILPQLLQRYGEEVLYKGGLRIYTTLDLTLQAQAEAAIKAGLDQAAKQKLNVHQGAMVVLDPNTGYIRAMIGGYDYRTSQFNRAWQAHRQPGSAFKPFTYTTLLLHGIPLTTTVVDEPISFPLPTGKTWEPKNFDKKWHGTVTMRYALENSINVASIRFEQRVGPKAVAETAHRMGVQSQLDPVLSLTLGSSDVTLLEMTSAYGVFASEGVRAAPMAVLKVSDFSGKVLEENVPRRTVVLSPEVAYVMIDLMKGVIKRGTGTAANINIPEAGKTGTADDYRNAWFIGYTPSIVTGVWVGNDNDSPMNKVVGGSVPAGIWASFMKQATAHADNKDWPRPANVIEAPVCGGAGGAGASDCADSHTELFIKGTEPAPPDTSKPQPQQQTPGPTPPPAQTPAPGETPQPGLAPAPTPTPPPGNTGGPTSGLPGGNGASGAPAAPAGSGTPGPSGASPSSPPSGSANGAAPAPAAAPANAPRSAGSMPLAVTAPSNGAEVSAPFTIRGHTRPGATVHIAVQVNAGGSNLRVADVYAPVDGAGTFSYEFNPTIKPAGATFAITVEAGAGQDSAVATLSVQEQ